MRVCVPITAEGQVDPRWGRADRVAVASVADGQITDWQEFTVGWGTLHDVGTEGAHHARVARFLRDNQVQPVAVRHVGPGMQRMLGSMGDPGRRRPWRRPAQRGERGRASPARQRAVITGDTCPHLPRAACFCPLRPLAAAVRVGSGEAEGTVARGQAERALPASSSWCFSPVQIRRSSRRRGPGYSHVAVTARAAGTTWSVTRRRRHLRSVSRS